jgi:hypothetical protein
MRARIVIALGLYWGGIAQATEVIAAISALGAIGGLPALLSKLAVSAAAAGRQFGGASWARIIAAIRWS